MININIIIIAVLCGILCYHSIIIIIIIIIIIAKPPFTKPPPLCELPILARVSRRDWSQHSPARREALVCRCLKVDSLQMGSGHYMHICMYVLCIDDVYGCIVCMHSIWMYYVYGCIMYTLCMYYISCVILYSCVCIMYMDVYIYIYTYLYMYIYMHYMYLPNTL